MDIDDDPDWIGGGHGRVKLPLKYNLAMRSGFELGIVWQRMEVEDDISTMIRTVNVDDLQALAKIMRFTLDSEPGGDEAEGWSYVRLRRLPG
jgi:hypothetical protein